MEIAALAFSIVALVMASLAWFAANAKVTWKDLFDQVAMLERYIARVNKKIDNPFPTNPYPPHSDWATDKGDDNDA